MSKNEFLSQLSTLLSDLSPEERDEAIAYYREYIEDAGLENEETILEELGTPEKVAAAIQSDSQGKTTEDIPYASGDVKDSPDTYRYVHSTQTDSNKKQGNNATLLLLIILAAFTSPLWIGLLGGLFGILVGILAAVFGLILGFGIAGIVCLLAGVITFIAAFPAMVQSIVGGFTFLGVSLILLALGILFLLFTGWLCFRVIPWIIRGISKGIHNLMNRRKEAHV